MSESRCPVNIKSLLAADVATDGGMNRAILDTLTSSPPLKDLEMVETEEEIWIEHKRGGVLVRARKV